MVIITTDKFDFYNLTFTDRTTYRFYKEYKEHINNVNSVHVVGFKVGVDDDCLDKLEKQFRIEGYRTENTKDKPIEKYDNELKRNIKVVYLTVGNSTIIGRM